MTTEISICIAVAVLAVLALATLLVLRKARRGRLRDMDFMEGHAFEYYCADLLR